MYLPKRNPGQMGYKSQDLFQQKPFLTVFMEVP